MALKKNIEFRSGTLLLRGWFYTPEDIHHPVPCIIMTHGFSALKEHYLEQFALDFALHGLCVLVYDNRHFGESEGEPRLEVDPDGQIEDMCNAITFVQGLENVDPHKIGIWGTSFSAGVAIEVTAIDKRVACLVAQVPFICGHHALLRETNPAQWAKMQKKYALDKSARLRGDEPLRLPVVTSDLSKPAILKQAEATGFFTSLAIWQNNVTLRSLENSGNFNPLRYITSISPTPLLFIVADQDTINRTDVSLQAYAQALPPKKLVMIPGHHFVAYFEQYEPSVKAARDWFLQHLLDKPISIEEKKRRN